MRRRVQSKKKHIVSLLVLLLVNILLSAALATDRNLVTDTITTQDSGSYDEMNEYITMWHSGNEIQAQVYGCNNNWIASDDNKYAFRVLEYTVEAEKPYVYVEYELGRISDSYSIEDINNDTIRLNFTELKMDNVYLGLKIRENVQNLKRIDDNHYECVLQYKKNIAFLGSKTADYKIEIEIKANDSNEIGKGDIGDSENARSVINDDVENYIFKQFKWGDAKERILEKEGKPFQIKEDVSLECYIYKTNVVGLDAYLIYELNKDGLSSICYMISEKHTSNTKYIDDYNRLVKAYKKKYGDPDIEIIDWDTKHHEEYYGENDPGQGLEYGFVTYITVFKTQNSDIVIHMGAEDYEISLSIWYQPSGALDQETDYSDEI